MLHETNYMANISRTMLQALRKDRGAEVFEPAAPQKALEEAVAALRPSVKSQNVKSVVEIAETPRVDVPNHVIDEVLRGMLSNALKAVKNKDDGWIGVRLEPYRTAGAKVELRIEDNGPGVPESVRPHLFEPFVTQSLGRETWAWGWDCFLAAGLWICTAAASAKRAGQAGAPASCSNCLRRDFAEVARIIGLREGQPGEPHRGD